MMNKKERSETVQCFQELVTKEIVNGTTYYRVDMDGQLNYEKFKKVLCQLEQ